VVKLPKELDVRHIPLYVYPDEQGGSNIRYANNIDDVVSQFDKMDVVLEDMDVEIQNLQSKLHYYT